MDLDILKIASDTEHNKNIENHTHYSKLKNHLCGDEIQIKLVIKKNKIVDFGYQGKHCIYCQASASLLSKILINKNTNRINEICENAKTYFDDNFQNVEKKYGKLAGLFKRKNLSRKECILLPFKALYRIVSN